MTKLQVAGLVGLVAAFVGMLIALVLSVTVWGASDAYGRLAIPGSAVVHLPSGKVDVAYEAIVPTGDDESPDLPVPDTLELRAVPANGDGPAANFERASGATVSINDRVHRRIARLVVAREGDYRVSARGDTEGATGPALRLGHNGPFKQVLLLGFAAIALCVLVLITGGRRRAPVAVLSLLLLAGCGGSHKAAGTAAVTVTPTPPPSEQLKYDLLTAAIQLDAYKLAEKTFTADETKLGPAFPPTVTVKSADATSFYMAARDDKGVRYVLRRTGDVTERTCDPPDDDVCPDGEW